MRKKSKIKQECKYCNKVFYVYPYIIKKGFGKYCSHNCYSKAIKGISFSPKTQFKKGHKSWIKGKKMSIQYRQKLSEAHKGQKSWNKDKTMPQISGENHWNWKGGLPKCIDCGKELKNRYAKRCKSCASKRKIHTLKTRKKLSKIFKGHEISENTRRKISLTKGGTGIPYELTEYGKEFDSALKEQVRMRDHYKCRICGCSQVENGRQLDVHHVDYDKENNDINNLIALCHSCHSKTNTDRNYWENYFKTKEII